MSDPEFAYQRIRKFMEDRLKHDFDLKELPNMTLSEMLSMLFACFGSTNALGSYNASMRSIVLMVGEENFWTRREDKPIEAIQ